MEFIMEIEVTIVVDTNKRCDCKKLTQQEDESRQEFAERVKQKILEMSKL